MFQKIRLTIYNILLLCVAFGILFFVKVDSFASTKVATIQGVNGAESNPNLWVRGTMIFSYDPEYRYCVFQTGYSGAYIYSLSSDTLSYDYRVIDLHNNVVTEDRRDRLNFKYSTVVDSVQLYISDTLPVPTFSDFQCSNIPRFSDIDDVFAYLVSGTLPQLPFDDTLELDDFRVSSGQYGVGALNYRTMFTVFWSDPDIYTVKVDVKSTLKADSFVTNGSSPFMRYFNARDYAVKNGDIVYLIATPYKQDGSYGISLMYSFAFNGNSPIADVWRPLVNNNFTDNTITIPYTGVSGNDDMTLPVSGVTTTNLYKVYYNPTTEEITNQYFYDVYYSPVVVLPDVSDNEQSDEIQETIINNYTTNNYYNVSNDIDNSIDIDLTDVSSGDIQQTYDDFGNFFKGFGSFVSKLALLFNGLFPFLSPLVAVTLVTMVGIIVLGAIVILVLKLLHIL